MLIVPYLPDFGGIYLSPSMFFHVHGIKSNLKYDNDRIERKHINSNRIKDGVFPPSPPLKQVVYRLLCCLTNHNTSHKYLLAGEKSRGGARKLNILCTVLRWR